MSVRLGSGRIGRALLALGLAACGGGQSAPRVVEVTTARAVAADYSPVEPTSQFAPDDVFYCAVLLHDLPDGERITARWFFEAETQEQMLYESSYQPEAGGSGYVAFELSAQGPWPAGAYRIELFIRGERAGQARFHVVAEQP